MLLKGAYCVGEHFVDPHCAYAHADRRLCWSHIPHCWKSNALALLFLQRNKLCLESVDKITEKEHIFFYFPENYSRRACKSTNKNILALCHYEDQSAVEPKDQFAQIMRACQLYCCVMMKT